MTVSPLVLTTLAGCPPERAVWCSSVQTHPAAALHQRGLCERGDVGCVFGGSCSGALRFYGMYLPPFACGGALVLLLGAGMLVAALLGRLLPEEEELAARMAGDTARTAALRTALITGAALLLHNFPEGYSLCLRVQLTRPWDSDHTGHCPA